MKDPIIVVNMKTYPQSFGKEGVNLLKACQEVSRSSGIEIPVCPPMTDLTLFCQNATVPILAQHADDMPPGSGTGSVPPEAVKIAGARGLLINHSEKRMRVADIGSIVRKAKELGLETIVCTNDVKVSQACAVFEPDYVAVEPPELIGGDVSVTKANPNVVSDSVEAVRAISPRVKVLTGAGVKTGEDVKKAVELGCKGVLLASGVVKAGDRKQVLEDLVRPLL